MYRLRRIRNWWVLTIAAALIVGLLLCYGLPFVVPFLRPLWVRLLCGFTVFAIWGLFAFLRVRRARRADAAIANELVVPDAADEEGRALAARMKEAVAGLKSASGGRRNYLYSRPWYVIIGPPGAGKTTALLNSGLRFPFAQQALKGVGGTRNLDFWFADEAALVDTAGRYTTQDSDTAVDARGWTTFLQLLRKHRPLQPINGVIVAIGIDELIRSDRAAIDAHAATVRRRLAEVRRTLEVTVPIYVLLTKADLLAGFTEYFDDLDFEGRRAVLGATLPFGAGKPDAATLAGAFDEMMQAAADRQAKRLFEEVDASRRSLLLGFPSQLASLRARLMRFIDGAFAGDAPSGTLRGFYLTSGVQEGAPLDRILSGMADVYDRPQLAAGAEGTSGGASGKAYFLNRLLNEVMFPEAGLVQADARARVRQRARLTAMLGAIALLSVATLTVWGVSFARNRGFQNDLLAAGTDAQAQVARDGIDLVEVRETDPDLRQVLPVLNALRDLPRGYAARQAGGPPWSMRWGLFQWGLSDHADESYRDGLRRIMLPRLLLRLEKVMAAGTGDAMSLYEPLKVYLMLGGQGAMEPRAVRGWIRGDWARDAFPGSDSAAERKELGAHLDVLLGDKNLQGIWPRRRAPLNAGLVQATRVRLQALSVAERAYAVLRQRATTAGGPWSVANVLTAGDAAAFGDPNAVLGAEVPFFFTRAGYEKSYLLGLASVQKDWRKDAWVLGSEAQSLQSELGNVRQGVAGLYAKDYIDAWEGIVATMKPGGYFNNPVAYGAFTKSPSPLKRVILELRRNTTFQGGAKDVAGRLIRQRLQRTRGGVIANDIASQRETGLDAGGQIQSHFRDLHDYVGDGRGQAPIDEFVGAIKNAGRAVMAARSVGGGGGSDAVQAAMATAISEVGAAATGAPPQLSGFVADATRGGSTAQVSTATGAVTEAYTGVVLPACKEVAQERYPFFGGAASDASMADAIRVFGLNGVIDGFLKARLATLLDTGGPLWRWKSDTPLTAALDPASPEEFAKAAEVRDLLLGGLSLKVSVEQMGEATGIVEFSSGATLQRFDASARGPKPLTWAPTATPEAYVALLPPEPVIPPPAAPGAAPAAAPAVTVAPPAAPARVAAEGPWALFRLLDKAERQNAGERAIRATFRSGSHWATLLIELPTNRNPFSRGGPWSFRCPPSL